MGDENPKPGITKFRENTYRNSRILKVIFGLYFSGLKLEV